MHEWFVIVMFQSLATLCFFTRGLVKRRPRVDNDQFPFPWMIRIDVHSLSIAENHAVKSLRSDVKSDSFFWRIDALSCVNLDCWKTLGQFGRHNRAVDHTEAFKVALWHGKHENEFRRLGLKCMPHSHRCEVLF